MPTSVHLHQLKIKDENENSSFKFPKFSNLLSGSVELKYTFDVCVVKRIQILKSLPHAISKVMFLSIFYKKGNFSVIKVVEIEISFNQ